MTHPEQEHPAIKMKSPSGKMVDIDKKIAPLIGLLWKKGVNTAYCCQGYPMKRTRPENAFINRAYIMFNTMRDSKRFLNLLDLSKNPRLMVLSVEHGSVVIGDSEEQEKEFLDNLPLRFRQPPNVKWCWVWSMGSIHHCLDMKNGKLQVVHKPSYQMCLRFPQEHIPAIMEAIR